MKKLILLANLAGITLFFTGCMSAYVSTIPTYSEGIRPASPSSTHIWIDGDWEWSRHTHAYTHRDGSWAAPNQGRTYTQGRWETTPRGNHWVHSQWK